MKRLYVDFMKHGGGFVYLTGSGTLRDLDRQQIQLSEGLKLCLYQDDSDGAGRAGHLHAEAEVFECDDHGTRSPSYHKLSEEYVHEMIDHAEAYVRGRCHTNGLENFWSLFKRSIDGTYVAVDAQHLERYVDEQVFRFNERKTNDAGRFAIAMPGVVGKRLMYKTLIGADIVEGLQ